ncbi:MAG TPA: AAA family ATPase [Bacteroidales bacterium]|nr:AAA family ATPase [Bacteroidales bacterium]HPS18373.1 AAA family ATPase [Bacteroidales bacterium]
MTNAELNKLLHENFAYTPTEGQSEFLKLTAEFLLDREERNVLIMKGYAGTGKTTIVKSVVDVLEKYNHSCMLLAPTGRSAKVLSNYSAKPAFTIHKKIYKLRPGADGAMQLILLPNLHKNTLFIVDEASMIQNNSGSDRVGFFPMRSLLDDLMEYVFNGNNCRLVLIGDTAQLPPIGMEASPALDENYMKAAFGIQLRSYELTEVVRQESMSGILQNATIIRKKIKEEKNNIPKIKSCADVLFINGAELEDAIQQAYTDYGEEETIILCRSNKRANIFNAQIRARILRRESEISGGDLMMVVKNNYFWLNENSASAFIANGEMIKIQRVKSTKELYGFRFAEAQIKLVDFPDESSFDTILLLDTITSEQSALSNPNNKKLYENILEDYADIPEKRKRLTKVREDKFYNALQVKFSYAVTCHKAQGGQWKAVFVDFGYLAENSYNQEFLRWFYTAVTRATEKLYLVNTPETLIDQKVK